MRTMRMVDGMPGMGLIQLLLLASSAAGAAAAPAPSQGAQHATADGCDVAPALAERCKHQELFVAPSTPTTNASSHAAWLAQLREWRPRCRAHVSYNGSIYDEPALQWVRAHQWVQPQMHPFDLAFYDRASATYTVDRYLADLETRYGGIDSLLLWPSYPLLGLDDRSQFEMFDALPQGGVAALRGAVVALHARGVRVLLPYLPWDAYTRPDGANRSDAARVAELVARAGADGANADSAVNIAEPFFAASVAAGRPAAWQVENGPDASNPTALNWQVMDIGYWGGAADGNYTGGGGGSWPWAPAVDKWKWFDARRITVVSDRWSRNKTDNLQAAFFNGDGYEAWENLWGCWNGITPRDGAALRRVSAMLRFFSARGGFTQSAGWVPHTPEVVQGGDAGGVFGSKWPLLASRNETLWTLVNRGGADASGVQLQLDGATYGAPDWRFYDAYHGAELLPARTAVPAAATAATAAAAAVSLSFTIEGGGYGAVLATRNSGAAAAGTPLARFLRTMANETATPLRELSPVWRDLPQTMVPTVRVVDASDPSPRGMVLLPAGAFRFNTTGVELEDRTDVQFPWESAGQFPWVAAHVKQHARALRMPQLWVDATPVTCADYADFLNASGYAPTDGKNWLRNWAQRDGGLQPPRLPPALARVPVTYVSYNEAAAYCAFRRKRLPQTYEWQYAAQGGAKDPGTLSAYPWGAADDAACRPDLSRGRTIPGAEAVDAYPASRCASAFGVSDLVGNVWQLTSSFADAHTASVVLKGGSNYFPVATAAAKWYFKNVRESLFTHNKAFLMDDAFERAGTVGFRCVRDVEGQPPVRW